MKATYSFLSLLALMLLTTSLTAQTLYNADFTTEDDGFADHSTSSPPATGPATAPGGLSPNNWTASYLTEPGTDGTDNEFSVNTGVLRIQDWGGTSRWESATIDVSSINAVNIAAIGATIGSAVQNGSAEFFEYFYILDGGAEVATSVSLSGDTAGTAVNYTLNSLDVSSASSLVVGFNFNVNGSGDGYEISSVEVTEATVSSADGLGSAALTNSGVAALSSTNVVQRDLTSQQLELAFTGVGLGTITAIEIDVPAGFSSLTAGNISLSGTGFSGAAVSLNSSTIQITGAALTNTATGTVTLSGLTSSATGGEQTFTVRTGETLGTIAEISTSPTAVITSAFSDLKVNDVDGIPVNQGANIAVEGISSFSGTFTTGDLNTYIQEGSTGLGVFLNGGSNLTEGNTYIISGTLGFFSGLTQINPADQASIIDLGASTAPVAVVVSIATLNAAPETYEGVLVQVSGVSITGGDAWPAEDSSANVTISDDGGTNTIDLRIDSDTDIDGTSQPANGFTLTGILSQFDPSAPHDSGYQIIPRDANDIVGSAASAYDSWATSVGLTAGNNGSTQDPNSDGITNIEHFAFNSNPLSTNGEGHGGRLQGDISDVSSTDYLTYTFPVRTGATFSGAGPLTASIDGINYSVSGALTLSGSFNEAIVEVTPALSTGLPALDSGWEYRTFRLPSSTSAQSKGFLQVEILQF